MRVCDETLPDASAAMVGMERVVHEGAAWHDAGYSPSRPAALRWCETLANLLAARAYDDGYAEVGGHFLPDRLVTLAPAIAATNARDRLNAAFRIPAGGDVPPACRSSRPGGLKDRQW